MLGFAEVIRRLPFFRRTLRRRLLAGPPLLPLPPSLRRRRREEGPPLPEPKPQKGKEPPTSGVGPQGLKICFVL